MKPNIGSKKMEIGVFVFKCTCFQKCSMLQIGVVYLNGKKHLKAQEKHALIDAVNYYA